MNLEELEKMVGQLEDPASAARTPAVAKAAAPAAAASTPADSLTQEELEALAAELGLSVEEARLALAQDSADGGAEEQDDEVAALERKIAALDSDDLSAEEIQSLASQLGVSQDSKPAAKHDDDDEDEVAALERQLAALESGDMDLAELEKMAGGLGGKSTSTASPKAPAAAAPAPAPAKAAAEEEDDEFAELQRKIEALDRGEISMEELAAFAAELGLDESDLAGLGASSGSSGGSKPAAGAKAASQDDELAELQRKLAALDAGDMDLEELARVAGELGIDPSEFQ